MGGWSSRARALFAARVSPPMQPGLLALLGRPGRRHTAGCNKVRNTRVNGSHELVACVRVRGKTRK